MSSNYDRFLPLAERLDETYFRALDRLEAQVRDAAGVNDDVRAILRQDDIEVLSFSTDFANSPREVFNAFADALSSKVMPELSIAPARDGHRINDLIDWSDMPMRGNRSEQEHQLAKIAYARSKSMRAFLQHLIIRFNPSSLPEAAVHRALQDFISVFSISTAMGVAIPIRRENAPAVLRYTFHRQEDEPTWHLIHRHHTAVIRGTNAMATIALLNKQHTIATSLSDMLNALDVRLSQTLMRFESGQAFHGATYLKLMLQRDGADFHLGSSLFDLVRGALQDHISDINLVYH